MRNKYMQAALAQAIKAGELGEVPVGAVIVKDNKIIASAHNLCESEGNSLLHAEMIAMSEAMKKLDNSRLDDCDLYVTLEPCLMCCGAISHARIRRLYFGAYDKGGGCVVSNSEFRKTASPLSDIECYCGIMEDECSEVLSKFFQDLRQCSKKDSNK